MMMIMIIFFFLKSINDREVDVKYANFQIYLYYHY